jgi:uncharacterized membrane protein YqhA
MTPLRVSIVASIAAFALLIVIFELIRSRRLQERDALLWLLTSVVILVLASFFVLVVLLHYSTVISKLSDENRILAQRLALLEHRVESETADEH